MAIKKVKVSDLPSAQDFDGLYTLGLKVSGSVDEFGKPIELRESVKVGLEFVKSAADKANDAAFAANEATTSANSAAESATAATKAASLAATAANTATEATKTATAQSDLMTAAAAQAASQAGSAATLANEKAALAELRATEINDSSAKAIETAEHPTYVGTDNFVYKWDFVGKAYQKTDIYVKGDTGITPDIALSVTMLDEGAEPTVERSGTAAKPSIALGIPQGVRGDKGAQGDAFTFDDFTQEQIELLQQPAVEAAYDATQAVENLLRGVVATPTANGLMSSVDKTKLDAMNDADKANKDLSNVSFVGKSLLGAKISDCTVDKSLVSVGYYKAPDGLMIHWGYVTSTSATGTIYFYPSFTNVFSMATSIKRGGTPQYTGIIVCHDTLTKTSFSFDKRYIDANAVGTASEPFYYMAIGTWK